MAHKNDKARVFFALKHVSLHNSSTEKKKILSIFIDSIERETLSVYYSGYIYQCQKNDTASSRCGPVPVKQIISITLDSKYPAL